MKKQNQQVPATIGSAATTSITGGPLQIPVKLECQFLVEKGMFWMLVEFDSYSRTRNLIQDMSIFDIPVDVPELRKEFPVMFKQIEDAVLNNADTYYNSIEETEKLVDHVTGDSVPQDVHPDQHTWDMDKSGHLVEKHCE